MITAMNEAVDLQSMDEGTRQLVLGLMGQLQQQSAELRHKQALLDKLTFENAMLKRMKFAARSEALSAEQRSLLEDALDEDLQAVALEIEQMGDAGQPAAEQVTRQQPRRQPLPPELPRQELRHEPTSTECCGQPMKRIGEDVAEKLDYTPGVFTVHRFVRGKWACACCQTLSQAPVDAHIIDKGLATTGLLSHVLVAKYADHLPLHRQEAIYARAGVPIPRSTLAQWVGSCGVQLQPLASALRAEVLAHAVLHADETPVQMLKPAAQRDGKTQRAYLWAYTPGRHEQTRAVVYDFSETRAGRHPASFLEGWAGTLLVDDFAGYKQLMGEQIQEAGCWAHARRKFFELHTANKSQLAEQALALIGQIYEAERQAQGVEADERLRIRQQQSRSAVDRLHLWLTEHRGKVPSGSATAKAMDYSLRRWPALTRFLEDGRIPIDNNWVENQMRPIALGRKNWLFAGSLRAGQRAAAIMSLIQSAKLNGLDPYALHGPPKECKYRLGDSLKGLQPYIRAICAGNAAAHDGYLRSGLLSISRTQGTGIRLEYPRPGLTFNSSLCLWQALLQNGSTQLFINSGVWLQLRHMVAVSAGFHLTWSKSAPLARIAQTARAILLANATTTTL